MIEGDASGSRIDPIGANWLDGAAWRDGAPVFDGPTLASDRALIVGDGLYETMRVCEGVPVLFRDHVERIEETARFLEFRLPDDFRVKVVEAIDTLSPMLGDPAKAWLRVTVTRGQGPPGLPPPERPAPRVLVRMVPMPDRPPAPQNAWIIDRPRIDPADPLSGRKTISSMRWVVANQVARKKGAEVALLRTLDGDIAEADSATLFVVLDDEVVTPPLSRGVLPGTVRFWVLDELRRKSWPCGERALQRDDLFDASEVFLSSSVGGVRPLSSIDDRRLPEDAPVCTRLSRLYEELRGEEDWRRAP